MGITCNVNNDYCDGEPTYMEVDGSMRKDRKVRLLKRILPYVRFFARGKKIKASLSTYFDLYPGQANTPELRRCWKAIPVIRIDNLGGDGEREDLIVYLNGVSERVTLSKSMWEGSNVVRFISES